MPDARADDGRTTRPPEPGSGAGRTTLRLSLTQLTAVTAATVSGAFAASFLGVYGTIIGTAVMSVISTAGAVIYQHYLDRTRDRLRNTRPVAATRSQRRGAPGPASADTAGTADTQPDAAPNAHGSGIEAGDRAGTGAGEGSAATESGGRRSRRSSRRRRVVAGVAGTAALVCLLALGIISLVEAVVDKPTARIVTGQAGSGTTLGTAVREGSPAVPPEKAPRPAPQRSTPGAPERRSEPGAPPHDAPADPRPREPGDAPTGQRQPENEPPRTQPPAQPQPSAQPQVPGNDPDGE